MIEDILYIYFIVLLIWLVGASWECSKPNKDGASGILMFAVAPFWPAAIIVVIVVYPFVLLTRWFKRLHKRKVSV